MTHSLNFVILMTHIINSATAENNWTDNGQPWYEIMKESQGLICAFLGSCILLALVLVLVNLHLSAYQNQRRQKQFIARLNDLLDTQAGSSQATVPSTENNRNSTEIHISSATVV